MEPCPHNHLIRDENMPVGYSCESCGLLFEVKPYGDDHDPKVVRGAANARG